MPTKQAPLLCELHAHTTWSDGALGVRELCDLYGRRGFDVLAITDHTPRDSLHVHEWNFREYLLEVELEAIRARRLYDLLVIPGLELTYDDEDARAAAHAVAVGLREFVGVADGIAEALRAVRARGAALVAAHPYTLDDVASSPRGTARFAHDPDLAALVDRFELFNRQTYFAWVADRNLPVVANGDFHRPEHLATWKTGLPCPKDERAVVDYLRSSRPTYLVRMPPLAQVAERAA